MEMAFAHRPTSWIITVVDTCSWRVRPENIKRRKLFQKAVEDAKIAFYTEIGSSPKLSKDLVVGQVYKLAGKLAEEGEAYNATDALLNLAKIRGWWATNRQLLRSFQGSQSKRHRRYEETQPEDGGGSARHW
jgi:hypothetical protein